MFLDRILTPADLNVLLEMYRDGQLETAPEYLTKKSDSKNLTEPSKRSVVVLTESTNRRDSITGGNAVMYTRIPVIPRLSAEKIKRLLERFQQSPSGLNLLRIRRLLSLGMGCPLRPEYAQLLGGYDVNEDVDREVVKSIVALFKTRMKDVRAAMDGDKWFYPEKMLKQLMQPASYFQASAVGKARKPESLRVPEGQPVAMFFSRNLDPGSVEFTLTGAYEITEKGYLAPITTTVTRQDARKIVRQFKASGLSDYNHIIVWGYLVWPEKPQRNYVKARFLDTESYDMLIDQYAEYRTPEYDKNLKRLRSREYYNSLVERKGEERAKALIAELRRVVDRYEADLRRDLRKTGPIATMDFVAVDLAVFNPADNNLRAIRSEIDRVQRSLSKIGFNTLVKCGLPLTEEVHYIKQQTGRVWSV